ncbi:hypothetical protein ABH930_004754 [Kitasatospora sp. GAS204A]|uniref:hypothetical protein n=1 Tax=unclassified Kitasatospora TaxID=2633591 RepID=UPI00247400D4|nr:hypothetical protein [Kitasatospora sp. GAS204B]MDH6120351.1 hypothetical protein [Kitasatospora sp. GAS204B]
MTEIAEQPQQPHQRDDLPPKARRQVVPLVVSTAALGIALVHVLRPDLKIDTITVVLLVVALLPWLGTLIESIEFPGGGKVQYRQLRAETAEARQEADEARQEAGEAVRTALAAVSAQAAIEQATPADVERLAARYTELRQSMSSGAARTRQVDRLVGTMMVVTPRVPDFDVLAALRSADPGLRLAGYARVFGEPETAVAQAPEVLAELLTAVAGREPLGSSRYWAIRALDAGTDVVDPGSLPGDLIRQLATVLTEVPTGSARAGALRQIIAKLAG